VPCGFISLVNSTFEIDTALTRVALEFSQLSVPPITSTEVRTPIASPISW
jgi:hypothetical protein